MNKDDEDTASKSTYLPRKRDDEERAKNDGESFSSSLS